MKKLLLSSFLLISAFTCKAQYSCDGDRFIQEVFENVDFTADITYGSSVPVSGGTQSLELDLFQPQNDTMSRRPLIIFAHGGSFLFGSKESADIVTLCNKYSKLGYVTATINYRLGYENFIPNANTATETVYRATSDMRAAVRFFRKDAATNNLYKIDTSSIFVAGVSAGAFIALHLAYLDQENEIPTAVDPVAFGGIEGNSGNPGYSSKVKAIVNLCGALGDTAWIQPGDVPCLSMHGTNDVVVPYGSAVINVLGIPLFEVDGSSSVALRQQHLGLENEFVTWQGAPHTPFISSAAYMDSVIMAMTPFLANQLGCDVISSTSSPEINTLNVFPNPANEYVQVVNNNAISSVQITDLHGKLVQSAQSNAAISTKDLSNGLYFIRVQNVDGTSCFTRLLVQHD